MNEHENGPAGEGITQTLTVLETGEADGRGGQVGLVLDLSGIQELDVANLTLLLTAQQEAEKLDIDVWLVGVPLEVWQALHEMGLGGFFRPFPVSGEVAV